eukprot:729681-Pyramimonas_sp.AAC.1
MLLMDARCPRPCCSGMGGVAAILDFVEVPSVLYDSKDWVIIHSSRHRRNGLNILEYETGALCLAVRHAARNARSHGRRIIFLVDTSALALSCGKGRSGSQRPRRILRRIAAL